MSNHPATTDSNGFVTIDLSDSSTVITQHISPLSNAVPRPIVEGSTASASIGVIKAKTLASLRATTAVWSHLVSFAARVATVARTRLQNLAQTVHALVVSRRRALNI